MSINKISKILILMLTVLLFQSQFQNLYADDSQSLDDEELPAIDPFAGGVGNTSQGSSDTTSQSGQGSGLLNNMRLVGTILGENKKIAIFSSPDGGAFKFEENDTILFGRESSGVPEKIHKKVENRLKIPMETNKRSLNLASSVAIILAECLKQVKWT